MHFRHAEEFRARFPRAEVAVHEVYAFDHNIATCPGGTASIDLAVDIVSRFTSRTRATKGLADLLVDEHRSAFHAPDQPFRDLESCGDKRVEAAIRLMRQDLSGHSLVRDIAGTLHVTVGQLNRAFKAHTELTPTEVLRAMRLQHARWRLFNSSHSVGQIAFDCGFSDGPHFIRWFRRVYGQTPHAARRERAAVREHDRGRAGRCAGVPAGGASPGRNRRGAPRKAWHDRLRRRAESRDDQECTWPAIDRAPGERPGRRRPAPAPESCWINCCCAPSDCSRPTTLTARWRPWRRHLPSRWNTSWRCRRTSVSSKPRRSSRWGCSGAAKASVAAYLAVASRAAESYLDAVGLLEDVDRILERRDAPECAPEPDGSACWMELTSHPGCYTWNFDPQPDETATWTGECSAGFAQGSRDTDLDLPVRAHGNIEASRRFGQPHGPSVVRDSEGWVDEGSHRFGKRHGAWVERTSDGAVLEGPYVDGEENGHWVLRFPDGQVEEGPFVDGRRNGQWVQRFANGVVAAGPYVDGEESGRWVITEADGRVGEGPYANGEKNGPWVERFANGNVAEGRYVDGKRQGDWVWRFPSGQVEEGPYVDDEQHGRWVVHPPDGDTFYVTFVRGVRQER